MGQAVGRQWNRKLGDSGTGSWRYLDKKLGDDGPGSWVTEEQETGR